MPYIIKALLGGVGLFIREKWILGIIGLRSA